MKPTGLTPEMRERVTVALKRVGVYGRARTIERSNKAIADTRESLESLAGDLQEARALAVLLRNDYLRLARLAMPAHQVVGEIPLPWEPE